MSASIDLPVVYRDADSILKWPEDFVAKLRERLKAAQSRDSLTAAEMTQLARYGLWEDQTRGFTAFGGHINHIVEQEAWQKEDQELASVLDGRLGGRILDMGASTAWTLRKVATGAAERVAIDVDAEALALGYRFARQENQDIRFQMCAAESLPFADETFDCVICRNALTYMHQPTAVREMTRVLEQNGAIFICFENIFCDLRAILNNSRGARELCGRLRDLFFGVCHLASGWQPALDNPSQRANLGLRRWERFLRCGRIFASTSRLRKLLRRGGCEIIGVQTPQRAVGFMGRPTQTSLLAAKVAKRKGKKSM
jgi:SAM-dependent methyltransferase